MRTSPGDTWRSVLFAAGRGERLRPLTEAVAKPALPILDVPLLAWGLRALEGFRPTIVNAGHVPESVARVVATNDRSIELFIERPDPFGTGGTLAALNNGLDDTFICWNSDMLTDLDAAKLWESHARSDHLATIAVRATESEADFLVTGDTATSLIDRRTTSRSGPQYLGAAVFDKEALQLLPYRQPLGLTKGLLQPLVERGRLGIHVHEGYWIDVGTIERYVRANLDVLYSLAPEPPEPGRGEVLRVEGGRAYVGHEAKAERDSLGPGAVVLRGARVPKGARVENAVVAPNEAVPSGASVRNAVWFQDEPRT